MKVADCCTRHVVTAGTGATLTELAQLMRAEHVGSVVIVDASRKPLGIVTDRDIVLEAVACEVDPRIVGAADAMSADPALIREDEDSAWALKVMRDRGVRRLPVVDAAGKLAGIVALDDLLEDAATSLYDVVQAIGTGRVVEARRRKAA